MHSWSVVIPSKNSDNLQACLSAIYENEPTAHVIVVDDGLAVRPLGPEYVDGVKPFVFARNANIGIRAAGPDRDVILLNDDAELLTPGGFTAMSACPFAGVLSAAINGEIQFRGTLPFVCVLLQREVRARVGLLDERYAHDYGWEDNDYCRAVLRVPGFRLGIFEGCKVRHGRLPSSFRGFKSIAIDNRNKQVFLADDRPPVSAWA